MAVRPAETQSTRHRLTAAALRSIVDGYRATVGAAIDTDTIDRHRDSADGGEIAARVCAHSQTATGSRHTGAAVCPAETQSTRRKATAAALRSIVDGYRATVGAAIDTDTIDRHRDGADGYRFAPRLGL